MATVWLTRIECSGGVIQKPKCIHNVYIDLCALHQASRWCIDRGEDNYQSCFCVFDILFDIIVLDVGCMFLVGGFAESPILQQEMRSEFGDAVKIFVPQDVALTVLKGEW
jgi:hypothetical protein